MQTKIKSCQFSMDFLSNIFQNITPGKSKNIHLKEAGTLPNFISNDDKYKISSLTLSGEINGTDLRLLRDMAGYNYLGVHTNGTLHELDMTDVRIVKGGDSYVQMHVSSYYVEADDEIPERIFRKCYALKKVKLPKSIKVIQPHAFERCKNLRTIEIPEGVERLGARSFRLCESLKSIKFPSTLKDIEGEAFEDIYGLSKIISLAKEPPKLSFDTFFNDDYDNIKLTVPQGSSQKYKRGHYWAKFKKMQEA